MATGDLIKLGTLYMDSTKIKRPQNPWWSGSRPYSGAGSGDIQRFKSGSSLEIRDTDSDDDYKMQWIEINDKGKTFYVADRVWITKITHMRLEFLDLLEGKKVVIDGREYLLRTLTGGKVPRTGDSTNTTSGGILPNEWDNWIVNEKNLPGLPKPSVEDFEFSSYGKESVVKGPHNSLWNWAYIQSWCQEYYGSSYTEAVNRGSNSARAWRRDHGQTTGHDGIGWRPVLEVLNAAPTLILRTENNETLYENDSFVISGTAIDTDVGDTVTVKYQINNGTVRTLSTAISNGASLPFNKNLTFKNKRLYDGSTIVSDELNGGTQHTLKVWAEDNNGAKSSVQSRTFQVVPNRPPTITLSTENYQTLYERDKLLIYGSTKDVDNGDSVTVRYQINSGTVRNLHSTISDGAASIPFSKELTYSDGVLKDGTTVLTSALDEGSPHTLSVWSEDGNGGKSAVQSRTFHVVPNRPPVVSVNPIAYKSDLIPSETIEITGNVSDLDDNDVTVTFAINDGPTQSVREGAPGPFSFNIMLKDLDVGSNRITIKAKDIYQAEVVKIVTINKTHDAVPINQAVALYKVNPPSGDAQKILLWIERQLGDLAVTAEVSMTNEGEPENFVLIERTNSELKGILQEDEFAYDAHETKTNIIIKIVYNRNDAESQETIKKISGVLS